MKHVGRYYGFFSELISVFAKTAVWSSGRSLCAHVHGWVLSVSGRRKFAAFLLCLGMMTVVFARPCFAKKIPPAGPPTLYLEQSIRHGGAAPAATVELLRVVSAPSMKSPSNPESNSRHSFYTGLWATASESEVVEALLKARDERQFLEILCSRNPDLEAARADRRAAGLEISQATALEITLSQYAGFMESGGVAVPVPGLFPFPGIISDKLGIARANANIARQMTRMLEREKLTEGESLLVRVWFLKKLRKLIEENLDLASDIHDVILQLYKDGKVDFADVAGARVGRETMRTMIIRTDADLREETARAAALLGLRDIPRKAIPEPAILLQDEIGAIFRHNTAQVAPLSPAAILARALADREELQILVEKRRKIEFMIAMVARMANPDFSLSATLPELQAGGGVRAAFLPAGRSSMTAPETSSSFQPRRPMVRTEPAFAFFRAILGQMTAMRNGISHLHRAKSLEIDAEVQSLLARLDSAHLTLSITRSSILPDLKSSIQSLVSLYRDGKASFADVVQGETRWIEARTAELEACRELLLSTVNLRFAQGMFPITEVIK